MVVEGYPQKYPPFKDSKTEARKTNQMATALSRGRACTLNLPQSATVLTLAWPGAGKAPRLGWWAEARRPGTGWGGETYTACSVLSASSASASPAVSAWAGEGGEETGEGVGVRSSYHPPHPRAWDL